MCMKYEILTIVRNTNAKKIDYKRMYKCYTHIRIYDNVNLAYKM